MGIPLFPALPPPPDNPLNNPPLSNPPPGSAGPIRTGTLPAGSFGIPATVLDSYQRAAARVDQADPACALPWPLLAAIGKVESDHAENGDVTPDGQMISPIFGPALNGANGTAAIPGTAGQWARAMGPMQFIPASWARWASDGNGDGRADPQNVYDASLAAARYLCATGGNLATANGMHAAILSYNHSQHYVETVLAWYQVYQGGVLSFPDQPGGYTLAATTTEGSGPSTPEPVAAPGPPAAPGPAAATVTPNPSGGSVPPKPPVPVTPPVPAPLAPVTNLLPPPVDQLLQPLLQPLALLSPGTGTGLLGL